MIDSQGWLDWAERRPGPPDKVYSQPNTAQGYVPHSMVGFYAGWLSRLDSQERTPDGRYTAYAAASVQGSILYGGQTIQHYPFTKSCWANGNRKANTTKIAMENEGGHDPHDEPLTELQIEANVHVIQDLMEWKRWAPSRPKHSRDANATLLEHHECVEIWGGDPTACASNRIPWDEFMRRLLMVSQAEFDKFKEDMEGVNAFQNKVLVGLKKAGDDSKAAVKFLSKIAVNHEERIAELQERVAQLHSGEV